MARPALFTFGGPLAPRQRARALGVTLMPPRVLSLLIRAGLPITCHRLLRIAGFESRNLRHPFVGTEHLLCALVQIPDSRLQQLFAQRGLEIDTVRKGVTEADGLGPHRQARVPTTLTPRRKDVLAIAKDQAPHAKHLTVPQSLFVAMVAEGHGVAVRVLKSLGFDAERLQEAFPESSIKHHVPLMRFEPGELVWFVHPTHGAKHALALVRDHKMGGYVFGGHTGSHYTGHGELWVEKLLEIQELGYMWWRDARSQGIVPANWEPPDQEAKKDNIVARIQSGEM